MWTDIIRKIEDSINNIENLAHGHTPNQVSKDNEGHIWQKLYGKYMFELKEEPVFKIGNIVLISNLKIAFSKESHVNWSREKFVVKQIHYTNPITYSLTDLLGEDIQGKFYKFELQLVQ